MALKQLKQKDIKTIREKWYNEQGGICPLFGKKYPLEDFSLDHFHCLKDELPDESGKGLCRGAIHFQANAIEGKITNTFKRYGGEKHTDLISFLRRLANYLECNKIHTSEKYIHPSEKPPEPKLMKSSYNTLLRAIKAVNGKDKIPKFSVRFPAPLKKLYEKYKIKPTFN